MLQNKLIRVDKVTDELEEKRKKKLENIQKKYEFEEKLKASLRKILEEDAYERLSNVKIANNEFYETVAQQCMVIYRRIQRKIKDEEILEILKYLKGEERKTEIRFERK